MSKRGFTLIELLIVVAIIAILAAIAVPNFLEAQTRAKVSRAKADMRSIATAIESYSVDNNKYPIDGGYTDGHPFWYVPDGPHSVGAAGGVTSPIAYMSSGKLIDPFRTIVQAAASRAADTPDGTLYTDDDYRRFRYHNPDYYFGPNSPGGGNTVGFHDYFAQWGSWGMNSSGPDRTYGPSYVPTGFTFSVNFPYDPTNGTVSDGDIIRSAKDPTGTVMLP